MMARRPADARPDSEWMRGVVALDNPHSAAHTLELLVLPAAATASTLLLAHQAETRCWCRGFVCLRAAARQLGQVRPCCPVVHTAQAAGQPGHGSRSASPSLAHSVRSLVFISRTICSHYVINPWRSLPHIS